MEKGPARTSWEAVAVGAAFVIMSLVMFVYGRRGWLLPVVSRHGPAIDRMMVYLLAATGTLFVLGHLVLGYFIWKFTRLGRASAGSVTPRLERRWSLAVGILIALIAEGGVLVLGLPVLGEVYSTPPKNAVVVEVTGEQFAWNVRYAGADGAFGRSKPQLIDLNNPLGLDRTDSAARDDIVFLGVMYLPVNRPARVRLRSKDVLHSFYLPHFRVKQDAVPGMTIDTWFVPEKEGVYEVACAELCGFAHYKMRAVLNVVSEERFHQVLSEEPPFLDQ